MPHVAGDCAHFNGVRFGCSSAGNTKCAAGVDYRQLVGGPDLGWVRRLPCLPSLAKDGETCVTCDKRKPLTKEEAAARAAEVERMFEASFARTNKAREAIVAHLGGPWKRGMPSAGGKIPCPCCEGGTLAFSRAGINGHIHARCSTEGCVCWIE